MTLSGKAAMSATIAKRMLWMLVGVGSFGCASPWTAPNSAPIGPPSAGVATPRWRAYESESGEPRPVAAPRVGSVAATPAAASNEQAVPLSTIAPTAQPSASPLDARSTEPSPAATYEAYALEEDATEYMVPLMQASTVDSSESSSAPPAADSDLVSRAAAAADEFDRMFVGRLRSAESQTTSNAATRSAPSPESSTKSETSPASDSQAARSVEAAEAFVPVEASTRRERFQDEAGVVWTSPSRGSATESSPASDDAPPSRRSNESLPAAPDPWSLLEDK